MCWSPKNSKNFEIWSCPATLIKAGTLLFWLFNSPTENKLARSHAASAPSLNFQTPLRPGISRTAIREASASTKGRRFSLKQQKLIVFQLFSVPPTQPSDATRATSAMKSSPTHVLSPMRKYFRSVPTKPDVHLGIATRCEVIESILSNLCSPKLQPAYRPFTL